MAVFKDVPTQQELQDMFTYDDELGCLRWKIKISKKNNIGDVAGCIRKGGYTAIRINGIRYFTHRLIYQYHKGDLKSNIVVDHITKTENNGFKDNRISNLRENSYNGNARNSGVRKNSKSGIKGVIWYPRYKKYLAKIKVSGKNEHLGYFNNKFDAYEAYRKRCLEVDPISYADSSKDMHPEVFIEYQEYLSQKQTNIFKLAA